LQLYACLITFPRCNDLLVEKMHFLLFCLPQILFQIIKMLRHIPQITKMLDVPSLPVVVTLLTNHLSPSCSVVT